MDPQEAARAQLEAYRARNPDEVTPEMMTRWEEWMDAAWKAVQNVRGQKTFLEEDPALERWRLSRKYLRGTGIEIGADIGISVSKPKRSLCNMRTNK